MSNGSKIWFGLLGVVAVGGGLSLRNSAFQRFDLNSLLTTGAPQQAVAAQWYTNDLLTIVIFELAVAVVAVVSLGFVLGARREDPAKPVILKEETPPTPPGAAE